MSLASAFDYPIHLAPGALQSLGEVARCRAPASAYAVITDEHVAPHYLAPVRAALEGAAPGRPVSPVVIPAGEEHKTRAQWAAVTDALLARGCARDTTLIALGGGVIGDLAGFVAATYMRGVPFIQVPTTLLAMVDASIGGKTGVDTPAGKNLVGAFHPPAAVVIDPEVLATLDGRQFRAGLAEVLKHGVIADADYFARTVALLPELTAAEGTRHHGLAALIARSVEIKAAIVRRDPTERGERKVLNFGHTVGHAVEAESGYTLLHGEAIGIGMCVESELAERARVASPGLSATVRAAVGAAGLPTELPSTMAAPALLERMRSDKKVRSERIEFALPSRVGAMAGSERGWALAIEAEHLRAVLLPGALQH